MEKNNIDLTYELKLAEQAKSGSKEAFCELYSGYKDKLYKITSALEVVKLNEYSASGAGEEFTHYALCAWKDMPVRERILKALSTSAKFEESVCGPYVLIDTENLEYEIVDLGGENH